MLVNAADTLISHVIALISEQGLEGVSIRAVANRAGVSIGAVQHHFPTKVAMLRAAMKEVVERSKHRYRNEENADPQQRLQSLCEILVPVGVDDEAARVWVAFSVRAVTDPEIAEIYRMVWGRLQATLAEAILATKDVPPASAEVTATAALAQADGLTINVLAGTITVATAQTLLGATVLN